MKDTINWAILGPGRIAEKFASAFSNTAHAKLYAVGSRNLERAKEFAAKFNVPKVYSSYDEMVADKEIDIVYVATPHPFHYSQTQLCLNHKKAVLCEKPLTLTRKEALEMFTTAKSNNVFLMEAMWSRFFPATIKTLELIEAGVIGEIKFMRADFGFSAPFDSEGRVFNLDLAGGAQLDVGVYPMFLTLLLLGKPEKIQALASMAATDVDETTVAQFYFKNGTMAQIHSSVVADTPKVAEIIGTLGTITLHAPWYKSHAITLNKSHGESQHFDLPYSGIGFEFQLQHVTECMRNGLKESPMMSTELSLLMAEVADEILMQCGIHYPSNNFS